MGGEGGSTDPAMAKRNCTFLAVSTDRPWKSPTAFWAFNPGKEVLSESGSG